MKRTTLKWVAGGAVAAVLLLAAALLVMRFLADSPRDALCRVIDHPAKIWPEYTGVTLPPNIAPLNFFVDEPGTRYCVRVASARGGRIEVLSDTGKIQFPPGKWRALLQANRGEPLRVDVYVKSPAGAWSRFPRITNEIAPDEIDPYLVYRLLPPIYSRIWDINIYRRNLESFEVAPVLTSEAIGDSCLNCHTFNRNSTDSMLVQIRSQKHGMGPVFYREGKAFLLDTATNLKAAPTYPAWHPSGKVLATSITKVRQFYHTVGEGRDTFDLASRIAVYRFDTNTFSSCPALVNPDRQTTYPAWSPDGRYLYYCARDVIPIERYREVRYDLMRIRYDVDTDVWGDPEVMLAAAETGKSMAMPRISPDGRYMLFTMLEYGNWPILQASADVCLMDLQTRKYRPLESNAPQSDSWHGFSSNGRWIVFSSKRREGLFARPYFSYFDAQGRERKPFLLPQEDPTYYDGLIRTFSLPELVRTPGSVTERDLAAAVTGGQSLTAEVDPSAMPPTD